ncbi:HAD-like domain-containing protein [Spinellus fusiger]|nr:HAD-like domain-containing protein [Spinellus fusiger]
MEKSQQPVFFFDCDNCLYHKRHGLLELTQKNITDYFQRMGLPQEEALELRKRYYLDYGLSVRGLIKHHNIDPIEYDKQIDGALPLESILKPDPELREMLSGLKIRKWLFTNAYLPHAERCLNIMGISDQFEGITYCNYADPNFDCKPETSSFERAMKEAGIQDPSLCYLVDDSEANVNAAKALGWTSVHVADDASKSNHGDYQINDIHELKETLPELWE